VPGYPAKRKKGVRRVSVHWKEKGFFLLPEKEKYLPKKVRLIGKDNAHFHWGRRSHIEKGGEVLLHLKADVVGKACCRRGGGEINARKKKGEFND